jgi:hypothetical protein
VCRNLAISLRSLALVSRLMPALRERLEHLPTLTDKQAVTLARNFDSAAKDYSDHLGESLAFLSHLDVTYFGPSTGRYWHHRL